jgi:hypothetical protein
LSKGDFLNRWSGLALVRHDGSSDLTDKIFWISTGALLILSGCYLWNWRTRIRGLGFAEKQPTDSPAEVELRSLKVPDIPGGG